jgi:hypothetical protein
MTVLSRPMFNRGGMVHDERTIRNVDDEIYRIAPKTHGGGRERMDAREEYGRLLREKDYLRGQMNRMANGGGVAAMMDPAMMAPPPMPMAPEGAIPAPVANELAAMEQQGMALGADIAMQQEAAIDSAEDPKQLIDAMRGNQLPLQERYNELATFVGPNDAAITPTSVLALTQPAIIMASEGAVDQGIGNLMEGMTGDIMMDDAMGAAPMGMGVGELMAGSPPPPVPMNTGGAVPKLQDGSSSSETAPRYTVNKIDLGQEFKDTKSELLPLIGLSENEKALQEAAIYANLADRAFAFGANRDPRTGEALEGNLLEKAGQAAQGVVGDMVKARAPLAAAERQATTIALQDALSRRTAAEAAQYALAQEEMKAAIRGPTQSQLLGMLTAGNAKIYAAGTGGPEFDARIELAMMQAEDPIPVDRYDPILKKTVYDMVPRDLTPTWQAAKEQRRQLDAARAGAQPQPQPTSGSGTTATDPRMEALASGLDRSFVEEFENRAVNAAPALFGPGGFFMGEIVSPLQNLFTIRTEGNIDRAAAQRFVDGMKTRIVTAYMQAPGLRDSVRLRDEYASKLPTSNNPFGSPVDAQYAYQDILNDLQNTVDIEQRNIDGRLYTTAEDYATSQAIVGQLAPEMENIQKILETLNRYTGINPIDFTQVDVSPTSTFMQDIETASGPP